MFSLIGTIPTAWYKCSEAIVKGAIVIMDNATSGQGYVKNAKAVSTEFDTDSLEGGLVGVAMNDTYASGETVEVALFTALTGIYMPAKAGTTLDPAIATVGQAPTTYFTIYREAGGEYTVNLDNTTKGVARLVGLDTTDNIGTTAGVTITSGKGVAGGWGNSQTGGDGTRIKVGFPSSVRFWSI